MAQFVVPGKPATNVLIQGAYTIDPFGSAYTINAFGGAYTINEFEGAYTINAFEGASSRQVIHF